NFSKGNLRKPRQSAINQLNASFRNHPRLHARGRFTPITIAAPAQLQSSYPSWMTLISIATEEPNGLTTGANADTGVRPTTVWKQKVHGMEMQVLTAVQKMMMVMIVGRCDAVTNSLSLRDFAENFLCSEKT